MKQKERNQKCGTKVSANQREREREKEMKRKPGSWCILVFHMEPWEPCLQTQEAGNSYNLKLLSNDRLGTRIVPRLPIFERNEGILQRE